MLLEEFFTTGGQISMEGPLYLKSDSKKGWKKYYCVLRASGLYYFPKEKTRSTTKDLVCLTPFIGHEVYKGLGWKKKHKAPSDWTFALRVPNTPTTLKTARVVKMLCAEDGETLEKWVTAIRVAKHGKRLLDNHKVLIEDLAREELDKLSSSRSSSIGSIISSVPSQLSTGSASLLPPSSGRLSRASSSSSSGCLSDDNNGFDSEFTTGTIKRKPSMKPNLPLTSMTRQLKEVGETTIGADSSNPASPEQRGGTLTRRHSRRRSEESTGSGTLKRRQPANRGSIESMSSSTTPTPTPSIPGTPCGGLNQAIYANTIDNNLLSPMETMPSCMTDSTFSLPPPPEDLGAGLSASMLSLDMLPPPPLPSELNNEFASSQLSLVSLPPPPPEVNTIYVKVTPKKSSEIKEPPPTPPVKPVNNYSSHTMPILGSTEKKEPQQIYAMTMKPQSVLKSPPYKAPPPYNGSNGASPVPQVIAPTKSVTFADSPVLLRRKVCFEDQVPLSPRRVSCTPAPPPPPRAEATRLSTLMTSPKRLTDSNSNPPRDFLKDLQRVMRKKWQVAQKCKLEPATTPHEVLGFRDFNGVELAPPSSTHFYSESANVSNWVQEHYGSNSLYENLGTGMGIEPQVIQTNVCVKKRPPPQPPKRSNSTQLTQRN